MRAKWWQRSVRSAAFACVLLGVSACGRSIRHDDDEGGSGASGNDGGTGGGGKGGVTSNGGSTGKGGSGAAARGGGGNGSGGSGGKGGTGGDVAMGGSGAVNDALTEIRQTGVDKVDLLLMIDNSPSMLAKQQFLAESVPLLAERLITPLCVDENGQPTGERVSPSSGCTKGAPEFLPIRDLHIGIITSSLGDHGSGDVCSDAQNAAEVAAGGVPRQYNDLAQLLPTVRPSAGLSSWNGSGFLVWDPRDQAQVEDKHPNLDETGRSADAFVQAVQKQASSAGEDGCGYEASLEAWYRFLVDPEPVATLTHDSSVAIRGPVNQVVLEQRRLFMRPDSVLIILMMSDENDCSIADEDGTQGWLVPYKGGVLQTSLWHMPRATSACATNPNDPCCQPCPTGSVAGCPAADEDPACLQGSSLPQTEDPMDLRCFNQVRRFGIDLLYPTTRYVEAITSGTVTPRYGGIAVPNPLFAPGANGEPGREQGSVILAGILGVPWQDLSTADSWEGRELDYLDSSVLAAEGRWDVILGDPAAGKWPTDTLMVESIEPRTVDYPQTHPLTGDGIGAPDATALVNPINGREHFVPSGMGDLQYACIFDLPEPVPCNDDNARGCDCTAADFPTNNPLCEGVTDTQDGVQTHGKAYPSVRELQVLKDIGDNAVVTSICAKNVEPEGSASSDAHYGYNPAISALMAKLKPQLGAKCLPSPLPVSSDDPTRLACTVLEATTASGDCSCSASGRAEPSEQDRSAVVSGLRARGACDGPGRSACDAACVCEIEQLEGDERAACQTFSGQNDKSYGFCYIDPAQGAGSEDIVADCPASEKQIIRFIGYGVPARNAYVFMNCGP